MKNDEIENEMFFIDRRYQDHRSSYRDWNRSYMKSRNVFFRKSFKSSFQRQKKCFVCDKIDCWSINHIQQKRNNLIKKFKNQKFHFWIRFDFNRKIQHWIIEYENENENETIHFFDNLIINFETYNVDFDWLEKIESNSFNSHQFFISYESLENFESLIIIRLSAGTGCPDGISRPVGIRDGNFKIDPVPRSGRNWKVKIRSVSNPVPRSPE